MISRMERHRKRRWWKWFWFTILILASVVGYYAYEIWSAANKAYDPREKSAKRSHAVDIHKDPFSVLLMGVDERKGDIGRADTLILITVNPQQKQAWMMNIPRDTYVTIPGHGKDKINHAYARGGSKLTIETVEQFLDIPVDYYVKVNMQGFEKIVDELGGVEVRVPFDFTYNGYTFHQGTMTMNGKQALAFTRMRKADPRGDLGRNERQQLVIKAILHKSISLGSITRLDNVFQHLGENVKTDMSPLQLLTFQQIYRSLDQMHTLHLRGHDDYIGGVYYYVVDKEERTRVQRLLRQHLELAGDGNGSPLMP
ncbi:LCP family glycopolymer transferase [Polycladomyces subterraneus]|uniref:LCP family protein n=1 Tax=Polycladomyces subterraneus TaxID=1016997 RepID=A0ABT8IK23_9BACL|nr:LCP family protein [Polycladomyces subterraneus]MDN4592742.1 LCP family protein [Polycladomyces subterraneus]